MLSTEKEELKLSALSAFAVNYFLIDRIIYRKGAKIAKETENDKGRR